MMQASPSELFDRPPPVLPAGFRYQPDLISLDEERQLVERIATCHSRSSSFRGSMANGASRPLGGATTSTAAAYRRPTTYQVFYPLSASRLLGSPGCLRTDCSRSC